jgi:hypothetical protein
LLADQVGLSLLRFGELLILRLEDELKIGEFFVLLFQINSGQTLSLFGFLSGNAFALALDFVEDLLVDLGPRFFKSSLLGAQRPLATGNVPVFLSGTASQPVGSRAFVRGQHRTGHWRASARAELGSVISWSRNLLHLRMIFFEATCMKERAACAALS